MFYWYQNCWLNCSKWFIYLQLVFKFILKIFILCTTLCTFNWYISLISWCTQLIYIFSNWYHNVLFWFHPSLIFLFNTKKGRILFSLTPLLMIDKKGEKDFEFIYAYFCFCVYWVYEKNDFESLNKKGRKFFETYVCVMHVSLS